MIIYDGGIFLNNPASFFAERIHQAFPQKNIQMISPGTGELLQDYSRFKETGLIESLNVAGAIDLFMNAQMHLEETRLAGIPNSIRIQAILEDDSMDKTDAKTTQYFQEVAAEISEGSNYKQMCAVLSEVCGKKERNLSEVIRNFYNQSPEITFTNHPILSGKTHVDSFLPLLQGNKALTSLTVTYCNVWDQEAQKAPPTEENDKLTIQKISEALKGCLTIKEINLSKNRIGDGGLKALVEIIKRSPSLEKLTLQDNGISLAGYSSIKSLIFSKQGEKRNSLEKLDLSNNALDAKSLKGKFNADNLLSNQLKHRGYAMEEEGNIKLFRSSRLQPKTLILTFEL